MSCLCCDRASLHVCCVCVVTEPGASALCTNVSCLCCDRASLHMCCVCVVTELLCTCVVSVLSQSRASALCANVKCQCGDRASLHMCCTCVVIEPDHCRAYRCPIQLQPPTCETACTFDWQCPGEKKCCRGCNGCNFCYEPPSCAMVVSVKECTMEAHGD